MLLREIELLLWPVPVYVDAQEVASRPRVRALKFAVKEHEQFPLTTSNIEAGVSSGWLQPLRL
ncbi:hypothetical protein C345_01194 [Cryptococcus neoformans A2-102-5]|nr:hypothetical protein C345_01194 [Cryptococcus neoformans var. grubii A2-102-5]